MKPNAINVYLSWAVAAIFGRLQDADGIMNQYPQEVWGVAAMLQKVNRQPLRNLYRGILLEPSEVQGGAVYPRDIERSISFSESRDAACYFALPGTIMSSYVMQLRPNVEGFVAEYKPKRSEILWHYKWNPIPFKGRPIDLRHVARMHPVTSQDPAQFDFYLGTQKEVILKPFPAGTPMPVTPVADTCPDPDELDRRFTPPHILPHFRGQP